MRIFSISPSGVTETDTLPTQLPAQGFVWLAMRAQSGNSIQPCHARDPGHRCEP